MQYYWSLTDSEEAISDSQRMLRLLDTLTEKHMIYMEDQDLWDETVLPDLFSIQLSSFFPWIVSFNSGLNIIWEMKNGENVRLRRLKNVAMKWMTLEWKKFCAKKRLKSWN